MTTSGGAAVAPSGTVTFLFSDIEGSTQRWDRDRAAMQAAVRAHDRLMRAAIESNGGRVFKTIGDAFCAAFATPEAAVAAALQAQRALAAADFSAVDGVAVRMAINTGTADERDDDYFGPAVNRVARLLAIAHGGQVLLSEAAAGLARENLPAGASLADLGEIALKDIERRERVHQLVAAGLRSEFPALRVKADRPWLVPDEMRTHYFTGRDALLTSLRAQLAEKGCAGLSGLGGSGKSQTALEYARRFRDEYPGGVFWINAETPTALTSGYVAIAAALGLADAPSADHEQVARAALAALGASDGWLVVLDNVDDRRAVKPFVPERGHGHVIVTSREAVLPELGIPRALEVSDFDPGDALAFLLARTGREDAEPGERAAAAELAAELGYLPLALEQAAAYVVETGVTFGGYVAAFRKRRVALLEKASDFVSRDTVAVTWAANFEAVEQISPAAADLLRISAFLAPDAIPFELFEKGAAAFGAPIADAVADFDEMTMAELLQPLARYSLIRFDATLRTYGMHRLVQQVMRDAIARPQIRGYVERPVAALDATFPDGEVEQWEQCDRLVPHVVAIADWLEAFDVSAARASHLLQQAGWYLSERGRYHEGALLLRHAVAVGERAHGAGDAATIETIAKLAVVLTYEGSYDEAQRVAERAVELTQQTMGPDHPLVAKRLNTVAMCVMDHGHYAEAEAIYRRALAIWDASPDPGHGDVAYLCNNLASMLCTLGRYDEAEPLYERAVAIHRRALGPTHPYVADALEGLADVTYARGSYDAARHGYEEALAIRERSYGPDHPDVTFSLLGLARVHLALGDAAEAERWAERAVASLERAYGPDHLLLASGLRDLATVRAGQGDDAEAERLLVRAIGMVERTGGPDHIEIAESATVLAATYERQGRNEEAAALRERALAVRRRALEPGA